jgi:hypothetical protein
VRYEKGLIDRGLQYFSRLDNLASWRRREGSVERATAVLAQKT